MQCRSLGGPADLDDVEAGGKFRQCRILGEQNARGTDDAVAFRVRDARRGAAVAVGGAVADFDDRKRVAVLRHEVDFAALGAEIRA